MSRATRRGTAASRCGFAVEDAAAAECAAVPTRAVHAADRRHAGAATGAVRGAQHPDPHRHGPPHLRPADPAAARPSCSARREDWSRALGSLLWARTATQVAGVRPRDRGAPRRGRAPTTSRWRSAKYFHALRDGEVPLEFLFSGTVFYLDDGDLLRAARIPWDTEATYRMPVRVWQDVMDALLPARRLAAARPGGVRPALRLPGAAHARHLGADGDGAARRGRGAGRRGGATRIGRRR